MRNVRFGSNGDVVVCAIVLIGGVTLDSTKSLGSILDLSLDSSAESLESSLEPSGSKPLGALRLVTAVARNEVGTAVSNDA